MLDDYVREKTGLYNRASTFRCREGCMCPGCNGSLTVSVSLLEMHVQASLLGTGVRDLFGRFYHISPYLEGGPGQVRVRFVLDRPCPFFKNETCSLYPVRPASCALFPEHMALNGAAPGDRENDKDYPCLQKPLTIPEERRQSLVSLMDLFRKEVYAAEFYLFGVAGFSVDIREELERSFSGSGQIPLDVIEAAFDRTIRDRGIYARIIERINGWESKISSYPSLLEAAPLFAGAWAGRRSDRDEETNRRDGWNKPMV